ncbi:ATP-binding protein [Dendrosporobacter sp. 1207_IL3150]|uniref:ATP-binding protein n=1 Tax=Dendrosporobacter sp. 1207_IL3150 TaxID=3084054 RepID=UPI002FD900F1
MLNLVRNALEAMEHRGLVTIRTYMDKIHVLLEISDTGKGIPEEILTKLGIPFFTTKENGTGLGLSVCYGIAERHGATVSIKTSINGTTFIVQFPVIETIKQETLPF